MYYLPMSKSYSPFSAALILVLGLSASGFAKGKARTVTGGGGFPISGEVTSMWVAVEEPVEPGVQPLTFMIYFEGQGGWHQRKWSQTQKLDSVPAIMDFTSDLTSLRAEYDRKKRMVSLFRQKVNIDSCNVILVRNVDKPGKETVQKLGRYPLSHPDGENPAIWVLNSNQNIRFNVMGMGR